MIPWRTMDSLSEEGIENSSRSDYCHQSCILQAGRRGSHAGQEPAVAQLRGCRPAGEECARAAIMAGAGRQPVIGRKGSAFFHRPIKNRSFSTLFVHAC